ncbi:MAG: hypothetical protein ACRC7C_00900 [Beijerinckiaceae bacterium]
MAARCFRSCGSPNRAFSPFGGMDDRRLRQLVVEPAIDVSAQSLSQNPGSDARPHHLLIGEAIAAFAKRRKAKSG